MLTSEVRASNIIDKAFFNSAAQEVERVTEGEKWNGINQWLFPLIFALGHCPLSWLNLTFIISRGNRAKLPNFCLFKFLEHHLRRFLFFSVVCILHSTFLSSTGMFHPHLIKEKGGIKDPPLGGVQALETAEVRKPHPKLWI